MEDVGLTKDDVKRLMPNFEAVLKNAEHQLAVNEYVDSDDVFDPPPDDEDYADFREMNKMKYRLKIGEVTKDEFMKKVNEKLDKYRIKMRAKLGLDQSRPDLINNLNGKLMNNVTPIKLNDSNAEKTTTNLFNVIKVTPDKQLYFIYEPNEESYIVHVCIENNTDHNVAFKIQSTNHSLYNVSPCNGIILPRKTINCTIKTANHNVIKKADKFLILASKVDKNKMTFKEFRSIWNSPAEIESVCLESRLVNRKIDKLLTQQSSTYNSKDLDSKLGILVDKLNTEKQTRFNDYFRLFLFLILIFACCFLIVLTIFCFILFNDEIVHFLLSLRSNKSLFSSDRILDRKISSAVAGFEL